MESNDDYMELMENTSFYQHLIEGYKNDSAKLDCMLSYLAKDEWFATEYNYMKKRDIIYWIRNASFYCDSSVLNSPLGIGIIISLIYLIFSIVGVLIYVKLYRK